MISKDYQAREVNANSIIDFGYEGSIQGWSQGFQHVKESGAEWSVDIKKLFTLRDNEILVILSAGLITDGQPSQKIILFFQTYRYENEDWRLVRSYIEAGITKENFD